MLSKETIASEPFAKLVSYLDPTSRVLEVGINGHDGENTSQYVVDHFGEENVTGINIRQDKINEWRAKYPNITYVCTDFYSWYPEKLFDVAILDLTIELNLQDWSLPELQDMKSVVRRGGYYINYVMTTTEYGDPDETPRLLAEHRDRWWGSFSNEDIGRRLTTLPGWEFITHVTEKRRPYITWVLLKKK